MTHQRAARFLVKTTRLTKDAQRSRESRRRAVKFSIRHHNHHRNHRQIEQWITSLLFDTQETK